MAISLTKGQKISLSKEGGAGLTKIVMGLGWDVAQKKGFMAKLAAKYFESAFASGLYQRSHLKSNFSRENLSWQFH